MVDIKKNLKDYQHDAEYYLTIECVEAETPNDATIVRIIDSHNGFEYEAFIIKDYPVGN